MHTCKENQLISLVWGYLDPVMGSVLDLFLYTLMAIKVLQIK